jgi:phosphopantetheinyl transferase (holo-ACP synthase)
MFESVENRATETDLRQQQRFEAQAAERQQDRLHFDTKLQDLRDLKTHDLIGIEKRFESTKEYIAAGFHSSKESLEKAVSLLRDLRDGDRAYFETKIADLHAKNVQDSLAIEQRFQVSKEAVSDALQAAKEAVTKAEHATERRFESVNEFRSTLSDQAAQLMPRTEAQARFETLQANLARIELDLRGSVSTTSGKSTASALYVTTGLAILALVASVAIGIAALPRSGAMGIDSKRVDDLVSRIDGMARRLDTSGVGARDQK